MAITEEEMRLRSLVQESERAHASRDASRAAQLLSAAQQLAPAHPMVLNVAALRALEAGQGDEAADLLRRAITRDAQNPTLWVNLAAAHRLRKNTEDEAQALERALALNPRHLLALLQKAALFKRRGEPRAAAVAFSNALKTIPPGTKLPESLRAGIEEAMEVVRTNAEALERQIEERLRGVRPEDGQAARFDHAIGALLGKRRIYQPEPTFMHFPMVPALEFYPREEFPWLGELEAGTQAIQEEFHRVFAEDQASLEPYIAYPDGVPLDQWAELNRSRRWSAYFLWRDGKPLEANLARCPRTAQLLSGLPMHRIAGRAPTAFFSILDAGAHIPAHTGVTNTRVIVHLPLVLPSACRFRVGSQTREWRVGEAWVFDDTIEHEAWNDSGHPRAILIFDVWNPYLTQVERRLVEEATLAMADYYGVEGHADTVLGAGL